MISIISYIDKLYQFFWTLTIFILFTCAFVYLSYSLKKEEKDEKLLMLGFTSVSFGLAFNQFFRFLSTIIIPFEHSLDLISILSFAIGLTIFFFIFDKTMKKTKYILFIINLILILLLVVFFSIDLYFHPRFFVYISYIFNATAFCAVLLWFAIKSGKEFKIISIFLLTGAVVYLFGAILQSVFLVEVISFSPIITYSCLVAGGIFFISPVVIKHKEKSQVKTALILCSITYTITLFVAVYFIFYLFLFHRVHYLFIIAIVVMISGSTILLIYFILNAVKTSKPPEIIKIEKELEENKSILSVFSRRELITEEEVSISKEKRRCLVCKTGLGRDMYMCPDCYAFYCKNCSDTLSNRENACWVCNARFDPSKPAKILKQSEKRKDSKKKKKKIAIITIIDLEFYEKVNRFKWDEEEKKEFITTMLALSPIERTKIINEMIEMVESLEKGEGYY